MRTSESMVAAVHHYAERFSAQDREGWLALFVETPEIIEPADAPLRRGREVLGKVFDAVRASGVRIALAPVRIIVNGIDAAVLMSVCATLPDGSTNDSSVIEIFTFASDGRIAAMRAFLDAAGSPVDIGA